MALRTVGVRLTADIADYQRKLRTAGQSTKDFVGEMDKAAKAGHLDAVADSAGVAGLAIGGLATYAIKSAAAFEKSMSAVQAATRASAGEMGALREAALQAGADTQYSATQAADGVTELAKAGVSTTNILGGGLKGALDLAAAGQLDVGEAAETAASAMTQFKLSGDQVPHIADLLAAAAGKAQGSVHDMGMALNQAGLVAAQTGLSIEETTGGLAAFANAGLIGSDAGTSFKQMLLMIQAPSDKSKELMDELGISLYDASGQFIGLTQFAGQLQNSLRTLTPEARAAAMAQIFGADATRAASIMYEQGASGIQEWIDKTNEAGYAQETAAKLTDNLVGDLERLKGSLETVAIQSGGGANEGLRVLAKSANAVVDQFGLLPSGISGTMTVLAALGGALLIGGAGWVKYRQHSAAAFDEMRASGPAGQRAAAGLQTTTKWAGRAAAAFAAAQIAAAGMTAAFGKDLNPQTDAFAKSLADWANNGTKAGEATRLLGDDFEHLGYDLGTLDSGFWTSLGNGIAGVVEANTGLGSVMDETLLHAKERLQALDAALASMVASGQGAQAANVFKKLAAEAKSSGVSVDELKKGLPQYAAAASGAGNASSKAAGQIGEVGAEAESTEDQIKALEKAFDDAFGAQMDIDRAALKYKQSLEALSKELTSGRKTLALNTEDGRKNRAAVLDQIDAINDMRVARIEHGESLDSANKKYVKDIDGLKATMRQAGFTKKEISRLVDSYRDIPKTVNTKVSSTGVKGQNGVGVELMRLSAYQDALKRGVPIEQAYLQGKGGKLRFAGGGPVSGPGTRTSDSIPAWLSDDEHVLTADEVDALGGHGSVIRLRKAALAGKRVEIGDEAPGFAGGGPVVWPFPATAAMTRIPSRKEAAAVVVPDVPSGGATDDWIVRVVKQRFPGLDWISKFRPGAVTLTGNRSYHSRHRAVDWPAHKGLAQWWHDTYMSRTKELITPWNELNIHNGRPHRYTGAVWRQHNFAGGNAHDHIAMANGGTITEPIYGVGASGRTYSFGENYRRETVVPNWQGAGAAGGGGTTTVNLTVTLPVGANPREGGRQIAEALGSYLTGGGSVNVRGVKVLG